MDAHADTKGLAFIPTTKAPPLSHASIALYLRHQLACWMVESLSKKHRHAAISEKTIGYQGLLIGQNEIFLKFPSCFWWADIRLSP
jgi:hypothetical protein